MDEAGEAERPPPRRLPYSLLAGDADRPLALPLALALPLLLALGLLEGRMKRWPNCCPPVDEERSEAEDPPPAEEEDPAELGRPNMGLGWRPLPLAWMLKAPVLPPCTAVSVSRLEDEAVPSM
jgi:hypothetical protein